MAIKDHFPKSVETKKAGITFSLREEKAILYVRPSCDVELITVDKGVMKGVQQKQCDALILDTTNKTSRFVELKGIQIQHACKQIQDTIEYFENDSRLKEVVTLNDKVLGFIVSDRGMGVPAIESTQYKKLVNKLKATSKKKLKYEEYVTFCKYVEKIVGGKAQKVNESQVLLVNNAHPLEI